MQTDTPPNEYLVVYDILLVCNYCNTALAQEAFAFNGQAYCSTHCAEAARRHLPEAPDPEIYPLSLICASCSQPLRIHAMAAGGLPVCNASCAKTLLRTTSLSWRGAPDAYHTESSLAQR